ncbi:nose resistant to fluoxetine protein 6-like isoform X1 [Cydia splendana]|uniref:nose resistant to fluoxetine protein 6-like isoform X1 n=2 Tax=Cydia splendana TaxID=1100963 RepID=UPI00300D9CD6
MWQFVLVSLVGQCAGVIYNLNETEYNLMPALYALDPFDACLLEPGGTYCLLDADLHSGGKSDLMRMIRGYSEHTIKHFNHTQIHRGVCVTKTCKDFIHNRRLNETADLEVILEACLNSSIWRDYKLHATVNRIQYCNREGDEEELDTSDYVVAAVYLLLIVCNVAGSLYDVYLCEIDGKGNPFLLAFSVRRNWRKLTAPGGVGPDPRLNRLKLFNGLRTMTMVCVFFSHSVLVMSYSYVDNPLYIEKSYEDPFKQILFNGSLVTHTFFVMSSFLLAYNLQIHTERQSLSWSQWPKGVLLRWLRLTPTYALVLATISTWMRRLGSGPLWGLVVGAEAEACRQYWWAHLLYINNYVYGDAHCAPQAWYLAADTQLFCLGLLICVVFRSARRRAAALISMLLLSLLITAAHTYSQDLDAVVIQSPEKYRNLYATDDTFRLLYIRGHTNLSTYTLGLAGGFLTYYWQQEGKDMTRFKKFRWIVWLLFPIAVGVILSGGLFYPDGPRAAVALRVLYAALYKPVFQTCVVLFIISCVFKLEGVYRGIVEWRGWAWSGRVSYGAFLLHTLFQRGLVGAVTAPVHMTDYYVLTVLSASIFLSFLGAGIFWVCVEAPVVAVTKAALTPDRKA